jgi:glycosyltransferase involved in cell wall biosynthesis
MNKKLLLFQGPVFTRSGYGDHSRDLLHSLYKMDKYDIKIVPKRWGNTPQNNIPQNEFGSWMLQNLATRLDRQPDIFIQVSVANEFEPIGKFNIGVTAGVETTVIPKDFIDGANKMDLVIVPSNFTKQIFEKTQYQELHRETKQVVNEFRVNKPVEVLFEGVDTTVFGQESELDILEGVETDFNFLFVGHWLKGKLGEDRKDVGMLIRTFSTIFNYLPKDKRPGLILKTSQAGFSITDRETIKAKINDVLKGIKEPPTIYLLHGDLTQEEMNSLYQHPKVKAMLSFTKGEGYGRPLAEFASTGKPVVVSGWSGQVDFLPQENSVLLQGSLREVDDSAADKFLMKESKWFTVNYSDAANKIYQLYNDYDEYLKQSKPLKLHIKNNFSLRKMKEDFESLLDKYTDGLPTQVDFQLPKLKLPKLKKL